MENTGRSPRSAVAHLTGTDHADLVNFELHDLGPESFGPDPTRTGPLLYRQRPQVRRIHHIRSRSQMFVARNRICVARARTNLLMDGGGPRSGIVVGINVTLPRPTARTGTRNPQDLSRQTGA